MALSITILLCKCLCVKIKKDFFKKKTNNNPKLLLQIFISIFLPVWVLPSPFYKANFALEFLCTMYDPATWSPIYHTWTKLIWQEILAGSAGDEPTSLTEAKSSKGVGR